ncbi:MAG: hypothetical protein KBC21_02480 [Candidatus Pacebacteria bacterium]|nr:hypothetical protein [Candidatus Paceibacterota bacterium]
MFSGTQFENLETTGEKPSQQEQVKTLPVQEQANYKGNWWLAQLDRFNNPIIRKQLVGLWAANESFLQQHGIKEYVGEGAELKDPKTGETIWLDEGLGLPRYEQIYKTNPHKALTQEEIESQIEEALACEAAVTSVDFNETRSESYNKPTDYIKGQPENYNGVNIHHPIRRTSVIGLRADDIIPNQENKIGIMSAIEAHEKGHTFRTLHRSAYLDSLFSEAFDLPRGEVYLNTYAPHELMERMAQLKNYFGMKGEEKFTPQHLEYAREHYLKDVNLDNSMTAFFLAITPEKEFTFLKLMNSIGI